MSILTKEQKLVKDQELLNELLAKADLQILKKKAAISVPLITWVAIHGNLCLALRHPENVGDLRKLVLNFVKELGQFLVRCKVYTKSQLEAIEKVEIEEGSIDFADKRKPT